MQCFYIEYECKWCNYCCYCCCFWCFCSAFIPYRCCSNVWKKTTKTEIGKDTGKGRTRFLPMVFSYFQICHILISINLSMEWRNDICQCRHVSNLIFSAFWMWFVQNVNFLPHSICANRIFNALIPNWLPMCVCALCVLIFAVHIWCLFCYNVNCNMDSDFQRE